MNFRDGPDGASRRGKRLAAGDRDGWRYAVDPFGVRLFERFEKLPGIGGERFNVTPLPFGIERVESERTFPCPTDTGHDDQLAQRQVEINAFQIMGSDLAETDGGTSSRQRRFCHGSALIGQMKVVFLL